MRISYVAFVLAMAVAGGLVLNIEAAAGKRPVIDNKNEDCKGAIKRTKRLVRGVGVLCVVINRQGVFQVVMNSRENGEMCTVGKALYGGEKPSWDVACTKFATVTGLEEPMLTQIGDPIIFGMYTLYCAQGVWGQAVKAFRENPSLRRVPLAHLQDALRVGSVAELRRGADVLPLWRPTTTFFERKASEFLEVFQLVTTEKREAIDGAGAAVEI